MISLYKQDSTTDTFTLELDAITSWLIPQYTASSDTGPFSYQLCLGLSENSADTDGISIMGHPFLTQFISVFDFANNRVGFGKTDTCPVLNTDSTLPPQPATYSNEINNQPLEEEPNADDTIRDVTTGSLGL